MNKPYVIAIPSYKRSKTVKEKTLSVLEKHDIDPKIVTIFVANQEEFDDYSKELKDSKYNNIVIGRETLRGARNFISEYYPEGTYIVNLDDDLQDILKKQDDKNLVSVENLHEEVFKKGFEALEENDAYLWGIYAASNPFFMKDRIAKGLYYVIGSCWGNINRHSPDLILTLEDKEDFERTLQYYVKDNIVVRLDDITVKSAYYKEKGGMQETRTSERIKISAENLAERFPDLCTMYIRETTGHAELKLKDRREVKGNQNSLDDFFV